MEDFVPDPANYVMKGNPARAESSPRDNAISPETLASIQDMPKEALISLIQRVSGAVWGIGLKSDEERDNAILLKLSILALTSKEAKDVVSTAKEYFDRKRGKPAQSIDLNQKIGIVAIVLEASKQRNGSIPSQTMPLVLESPVIEK